MTKAMTEFGNQLNIIDMKDIKDAELFQLGKQGGEKRKRRFGATKR